MTTPSIQAAFEIAKQTYVGSLAPGAAAKRLHQDYGFNINSARDLIMVYRQLMRGMLFSRGLSAPDMNYFLTRIAHENNTNSLMIALQSLWLHINYYEGIRGITMHKLRKVAISHQLSAATPESSVQFSADFDRAVQHSLTDTAEKRAERLRVAPKIPSRIPVISVVFARNSDVVAEVLLRANGVCEKCKQKAPFLRKKDRTPYLEVHHIELLADGGEDIVENAIALCPNCHRESHYGVSLA